MSKASISSPVSCAIKFRRRAWLARTNGSATCVSPAPRAAAHSPLIERGERHCAARARLDRRLLLFSLAAFAAADVGDCGVTPSAVEGVAQAAAAV
jgi:hypothetical protein